MAAISAPGLRVKVGEIVGATRSFPLVSRLWPGDSFRQTPHKPCSPLETANAFSLANRSAFPGNVIGRRVRPITRAVGWLVKGGWAGGSGDSGHPETWRGSARRADQNPHMTPPGAEPDGIGDRLASGHTPLPPRRGQLSRLTAR